MEQDTSLNNSFCISTQEKVKALENLGGVSQREEEYFSNIVSFSLD